jgi:hypothetical protein
LLVAFGAAFVDAERLTGDRLELLKCLANRGQLISSAAGHVLGIKDQERTLLAA